MRETGSLSNLPTDMLTEIFVRLPVRSLLFCKCVCKPFCTLISNPKFIDAHLNRIRANISSDDDDALALMTFRSTWQRSGFQFLVSIDNNTKNVISSSYAIPRIPVIGEIKIVGSSNGLLCAEIGKGGYENPSLLLFNPITKQNRYLPKPQIDGSGYFVRYVHEFGFVPETNDYKVVRIVIKGDIKMQFEVYKMSTDSWTIIQNNISQGDRSVLSHELSPHENSVFVNGAFHWTEYRSIHTEGLCRSVLSLNLKDEELGLMKMLDFDRVRATDEQILDVTDESLAMIYYWRTTKDFEIWVMNDYGVQDSWALRYRILGSILDSICTSVWPVGYWKHNLMVIQEVDVEKDEHMGPDTAYEVRAILYDLNTGERKNISTLEEENKVANFFSYLETLVPVSRMENYVEVNDTSCWTDNNDEYPQNMEGSNDKNHSEESSNELEQHSVAGESQERAQLQGMERHCNLYVQHQACEEAEEEWFEVNSSEPEEEEEHPEKLIVSRANSGIKGKGRNKEIKK